MSYFTHRLDRGEVSHMVQEFRL